MEKSINDIADELQERFLDENFIVQRYDAYSTNSIYIKLDYGYAHTIRISDHKGYERFHYRYSVRTDINKDYSEIDKKGFAKFYFSPKGIEKLVKQILELRKRRIEIDGEFKYNLEVMKKYENYHGKKGFWTKCTRVVK